jgi:hypothetical protein
MGGRPMMLSLADALCPGRLASPRGDCCARVLQGNYFSFWSHPQGNHWSALFESEQALQTFCEWPTCFSWHWPPLSVVVPKVTMYAKP